MDFNEVINQRKTGREWTDEEVDFAAIRRILAAGMKAPSWDHYRNWQFIYPAGTGRKRTGLCLRPGGCPALRGGEPRLHPAQPGAKNVCPCHAAAVYHADGLSICDCAPVQMRPAKCRVGQQAQSPIHRVVRGGKYPAGHYKRGAGLFPAHPAEPGARCCIESAGRAAWLDDAVFYRRWLPQKR